MTRIAPSPEHYLARFPPPIQGLAGQVRRLVARTRPDATEQVKLGWRAINLYVPGRRQPVFFGFLIPHPASLTFGFTYGVLVDEPPGGFLGADEKLVWARYLALRAPRDVRPAVFTRLIGQAAEAALLPTALREQRRRVL